MVALRLVLVMLVTATFLWGGCQSCPRFFMFPWEHNASEKKHCCSQGKCDRTSTQLDGESKNGGQPSVAKVCKRINLELSDPIPAPALEPIEWLDTPVQPGWTILLSQFAHDASPPGASLTVLRI